MDVRKWAQRVAECRGQRAGGQCSGTPRLVSPPLPSPSQGLGRAGGVSWRQQE